MCTLIEAWHTQIAKSCHNTHKTHSCQNVHETRRFNISHAFAKTGTKDRHTAHLSAHNIKNMETMSDMSVESTVFPHLPAHDNPVPVVNWSKLEGTNQHHTLKSD
jgi:hypothetical protein